MAISLLFFSGPLFPCFAQHLNEPPHARIAALLNQIFVHNNNTGALYD